MRSLRLLPRELRRELKRAQRGRTSRNRATVPFDPGHLPDWFTRL